MYRCALKQLKINSFLPVGLSIHLQLTQRKIFASVDTVMMREEHYSRVTTSVNCCVY